MPSSEWTIDQEDMKRVEIAGVNAKRLLNYPRFCTSSNNIKMKTHRYHAQFNFFLTDTTHSFWHWSTEE